MAVRESHEQIVARLTAALPPEPDGARDPLGQISWLALRRFAHSGWEELFNEQLPRCQGRRLSNSPPSMPRLPIPPPPKRRDWRKVVEAAIADGQAAATEISARDLKDLLALPPERRKAAIDADDRRTRNLLPADKARLRDSCAPVQPGCIDPAIRAAARLAGQQHKVDVLMEYVATYAAQLEAGRDVFRTALDRVFRDGEAIADRVLADLLICPPGHVYRAVFAGEYGECRWRVSDTAYWTAHDLLIDLSEIARLRLAALLEIQELEGEDRK